MKWNLADWINNPPILVPQWNDELYNALKQVLPKKVIKLILCELNNKSVMNIPDWENWISFFYVYGVISLAIDRFSVAICRHYF